MKPVERERESNGSLLDENAKLGLNDEGQICAETSQQGECQVLEAHVRFSADSHKGPAKQGHC